MTQMAEWWSVICKVDRNMPWLHRGPLATSLWGGRPAPGMWLEAKLSATGESSRPGLPGRGQPRQQAFDAAPVEWPVFNATSSTSRSDPVNGGIGVKSGLPREGILYVTLGTLNTSPSKLTARLSPAFQDEALLARRKALRSLTAPSRMAHAMTQEPAHTTTSNEALRLIQPKMTAMVHIDVKTATDLAWISTHNGSHTASRQARSGFCPWVSCL
jgi:hypothetical protein